MLSPFDEVTVRRIRALVASERTMSTPTATILQPGEQQPSKQLRCATRMFRLHAYHTRLVFMLACVVTFGILVSSIYSLNHFNLLLSSKRALDFSAFRELEREVPSVAADRRNWANVYFVKRSWFWNSLFTLLAAVTLKRTSGGLRGEQGAVRVMSWKRVFASKTLIRWIFATLAWCTC